MAEGEKNVPNDDFGGGERKPRILDKVMPERPVTITQFYISERAFAAHHIILKEREKPDSCKMLKKGYITFFIPN